MRIKDTLIGLVQVFRIRGGGRDSEAPSYPLDQRLKHYEHELQELRVENEYLRMSATTFGELAERLNRALKDAGGRGRTPVPKGG